MSGADPAALTVAYLTDLITVHSVDGLLARDIRCRTLGSPPTSLLARVRGEAQDPARHPRHFEVKAATFHQLTIDLERHRARVIVDI